MRIKFGFFVSVITGAGIYDPKEFKNAKILQWRVKPGDWVKVGDALAEVETDKVTLDLPAISAGRIVSLEYEEGEEWHNGGIEETPLGLLVIPELGILDSEEARGVNPNALRDAAIPTDSSSKPGIRITPLAQRAARELGVSLDDVRTWLPDTVQEITDTDVQRFAEFAKRSSDREPQPKKETPRAVPRARTRARELGVDLTDVKGTGPEGIIRVHDVEAHVKEDTKEEPSRMEDSDTAFEVVVPTIRHRTTAAHMRSAWAYPHAAASISMNPVPLLELRSRIKETFEERHGVSLRIEHFFIAAVAELLQDERFRILNAYWHEENGKEELRLWAHVNVGIAVALPPSSERKLRRFSELLVPSVKRVETLSFLETVRESERLIQGALSGKLQLKDVMGTTFIVNNTGAPTTLKDGKKVLGDEDPRPILGTKTAAELAFGAPVDIGAGKRMKIVLAFDHRVVNGREPITFLREVQHLLEDSPESLLILR